MENSKIEWTDHTFNPWAGCNRVSPACDYCYAANGIFAKMNGVKWGKHTPRYVTSDDYWKNPVRWNRRAQKAGKMATVFCASLADVFEDHPALPPVRERLWHLIADTPWLYWQLLTKRPGNIPKMMPEGGFPPNVWLGTTVESQEYTGRIKQLLRVPAPVHFLSCEPLLGALDLTPWLGQDGINWVIAGGEANSKHARPSDQKWFLSLRDQCIEANVAFFFKQWGNWTPVQYPTSTHKLKLASGQAVFRVAKETAGNVLLGKRWHDYPDVPYVPCETNAIPIV